MDSPTLTCTTCGAPTTWTAPPGFAPRGVEVTCQACVARRVPVMGPPTLAERGAALLARIAELEAERDDWRARAQAAEDLLADIGALARGEMAGDARVGPAPAVATWDAVRAALAERGVEVTRG